MHDPHKAHIVRPDVVVSGALVDWASKGAAARRYKPSHTRPRYPSRPSVNQSISQSANIMGIGEDCWCLGRWASGGRDAWDWETLRAAYARYCRYLLLPALWPAQAMLACQPWVIRYRVRPRQWNPATRGMVAGFSRGHPAALGPIEPCQPILILGASWYLPTCQPSAISPGWHHWSAQTLFCRGFVVPEKREVYPVPRDYWDGVLFSQREFASPPLPAAQRGQETRDEQACPSITQHRPVLPPVARLCRWPEEEEARSSPLTQTSCYTRLVSPCILCLFQGSSPARTQLPARRI